jgi:O-antigen/teichoic acid export membrane protein
LSTAGRSPRDRPRSGVAARTPTATRVSRNTAWLVAGDGVAKAGLFVLYALIARELGDEGFGDYTVAVSLAFFVRAAELGIDLILSREVARDLERIHGLFWNTIVLKLIIGLPILGIVIGATAAGGYSGAIVATTALIGASNLIDVLAYSSHAVLRGREDMAPGARALALETSVVVVFGAVAIVGLGGGLVVLGLAYLIAAIVSLVYIAHSMRRRAIRPRVVTGTRGLGWLGKAALPAGIASFLGYALGRIDAVILSAITDDSAKVGLYGGAYRIFEATLFVSWAFGLAVLPTLSVLPTRSPELRRMFEIACKAIAALTVCLGGAMCFFGSTIVEVVFGDQFGGAATATQILGGATALYGLFIVAALTITGQDDQRPLPWIAAAALAVNVALNFLLIPPLGIDGAAIAMTVAQVLFTVPTMWVAIGHTGRVSAVRMFAAVATGLTAMALVAAAVPGWTALPLAIVAYAIAFLSTEWCVERDDLALFFRALRRSSGSATPDVPSSRAEAAETFRPW